MHRLGSIVDVEMDAVVGIENKEAHTDASPNLMCSHLPVPNKLVNITCSIGGTPKLRFGAVYLDVTVAHIFANRY